MTTLRPPRRLLTGLLAALLVTGGLAPTPLAWAQLPSLGEGGEMTTSTERRLGDRIAREIYRDPDYLDDPLLVEYVREIWLALMASARARGELVPELDERFAWEIVLNRERSVNAFALPGGYMGVNLGLMGLVASRDELAAVMGHELSHITQRHISRLIAKDKQQMPLVLAAILLGVLAGHKNPDAANAAIAGGQALAIQNQLNFSRDMEREADRIGYGVMTGAGYEAQGFASMFEKLQQANRLNDNGAFPYLRSHPLNTERIAEARSRMQLQSPPPRRTTADLPHGMLSARARVLADPSVDALRAWVAEANALPASAPAVAASGGKTATGAAALQAVARKVGVLYAGAYSAAKQRDPAQARALLGRLTNAVAGDAEAQRLANLLAAEIALLERRPAQALPLLSPDASLPPAVLKPEASALQAGRPELFLWVQTRLMLGPTGLAEVGQRLQSWVALYPRDAQAWQLLSSVESAQGRPVQAARASGEARAAQYDWQAALDRFRGAQDLLRKAGNKPGGNDHIEASIIDLRTRELQEKVRESAREQALER